MQPVRIGIVGAGANTRSRHLPGFGAIDGVEVVCVANRTLDSARRVAAEFHIGRAHAHWRDVVDDPAVDAVCIGTWPYLHAAVTCAALTAGKHVLCEARMARNVAEARQMLDAAQQSDRVAMLVPSPLGLAGDRAMRELVAKGFLGELREVYIRGLSASLADCAAPLGWRQRADLSGVNMLALGILNETVQRWFGAAESVSAQTSRFVPRRVDPETGQLQDVDLPDSVAVIARLASGAQCVYHLSGHAHHGGGMRIEAFGSAGTLIYDLETDKILGATRQDAELSEIQIRPEQVRRWQVEADFVAAIRGERPVTLTTFRDGMKYMCFTEAVFRSAITGQRCEVAEIWPGSSP
ncbi:MAG: Gfo/Idh/MocA family protein [Pirellulales bacterium]